MKELAKWSWILLLMILYFGLWTFAIIGGIILVFLLVMWLKPEWLNKL